MTPGWGGRSAYFVPLSRVVPERELRILHFQPKSNYFGDFQLTKKKFPPDVFVEGEINTGPLELYDVANQSTHAYLSNAGS